MLRLPPTICTFLGAASLCLPARAASLPEHDPLGVTIISDGVNPHGLPQEHLTEPGELSAAIMHPSSGIHVSMVREIDSACVDDALTLLDEGATDVLVYFAHQSARGCDGSDRQLALTTVLEKFLVEGGGVVVFHHGIFVDAGKNGILQLLGGRADNIAWEPDAGQNVIAVAPDHFVTKNGLSYERSRSFGAEHLGVLPGTYAFFNNTPDERYPGLTYLKVPEERRITLFASDYDGGQALSYDLHRPGWTGHVVFFQPGEYQPHGIDDLEGNNFQILVNAIYYAATTREDPSGSTSTGDGGDHGDDTGGTSSTDGGAAPPSNGPEAIDTDGPREEGNDPGGCRVGSRRDAPGSSLALLGLLGLARPRRVTAPPVPGTVRSP